MEGGKLAEYLEKIFFPPNVIGIGGIIILTYLNWRIPDFLTFVLSLITTGIFLTILKNKIKDENKLYALSSGPTLLIFLLLTVFFNLSMEIVFGGISMFLMITIGYLIRPKWKISGHTGAATAVPTALSLIDPVFLPSFVIVPIVGWARLRVGAHTFAQVFAGFLLGFTAPVLVFLVWV